MYYSVEGFEKSDDEEAKDSRCSNDGEGEGAVVRGMGVVLETRQRSFRTPTHGEKEGRATEDSSSLRKGTQAIHPQRRCQDGTPGTDRGRRSTRSSDQWWKSPRMKTQRTDEETLC